MFKIRTNFAYAMCDDTFSNFQIQNLKITGYVSEGDALTWNLLSFSLKFRALKSDTFRLRTILPGSDMSIRHPFVTISHASDMGWVTPSTNLKDFLLMTGCRVHIHKFKRVFTNDWMSGTYLVILWEWIDSIFY